MRFLIRELQATCHSKVDIKIKADIFIGRTDSEAEAPILWPSDAASLFIGKDPDDGKD